MHPESLPHSAVTPLLNDWQRGFPLVPRPFDLVAQATGRGAAEVLQAFEAMQAAGAISRIGGIWAAGAGGAAMLCALAVPAGNLDKVAAVVNAEPGVNHNYEREHHYNLWFVITGANVAHIHERVDAIEQACGLVALRLPMRRPYRIDLGFDLNGQHAGRPDHAHTHAGNANIRVPRVGSACACACAGHGARARQPVRPQDRPLAALVECGLPLCERPYAVWARQLNTNEDSILLTLHNWLEQGTLRRFGVVVRHHEAGFDANAMNVFDVPDELVDAVGEQLARQTGITLCYRRERAPGWPYNLYCMVHGRDRDTVRQLVASAIAETGLQHFPQAVLFSRRRFKQIGSRYFSDALPAVAAPAFDPVAAITSIAAMAEPERAHAPA